MSLCVSVLLYYFEVQRAVQHAAHTDDLLAVVLHLFYKRECYITFGVRTVFIYIYNTSNQLIKFNK